MDFRGKLDGKDNATNSKLRIRLDADKADIQVGGNGSAGDIDIRNDHGNTKIRLDAGGAEAPVLGTSQNPSLATAAIPIVLSGKEGTISVGGDGAHGDILVRDGSGKERIALSAASADVRIGGNGRGGDIELKDENDVTRIRLDAGGSEGLVFNPQATAAPIISISADTGSIRAGGLGKHGQLNLLGGDNRDRILLSAESARINVGGNGGDGVLAIFDKNGDNNLAEGAAFHFDASRGELKVGAKHKNGRLLLRDNNGHETIRVEGDKGDVILANADCAEDFDLADDEEAPPGAVMVLSEDGSLRQSDQEYDTTVAGVISGAGSYRPGIVLDRHASEKPRVPVAMIGKVFCLVDADFGSVRAGSLLTTSPRRGHAMRAADAGRAFGAVLGKALKPLARGQALVPVMVALQ